MPRDRLEPVARQLARREVVTQHGVQRVDQLAARHGEPHAATSDRARRATPRRAARWRSPGRPGAAERERDAEQARAVIEERQIEAVQVVVLDHVRIGGLHARDEPADQLGLGGVAAPCASSTLGRAVGIAHRDEEDPIALAGRGRWSRDRSAAGAARRTAGRGSTCGRGDEVLLLGRQREHARPPELAQVRDAAARAGARRRAAPPTPARGRRRRARGSGARRRRRAPGT